MSISSPTLNPVLFMSLWHASFHLVFGRPLSLFPGISILSTYVFFVSPQHARTSRLHDLCGSLRHSCNVVTRMCTFLVLSLRVTMHIHRSIIVWICVHVMRFQDVRLVTCINLLCHLLSHCCKHVVKAKIKA